MRPYPTFTDLLFAFGVFAVSLFLLCLLGGVIAAADVMSSGAIYPTKLMTTRILD